jgi:hypothetical protein
MLRRQCFCMTFLHILIVVMDNMPSLSLGIVHGYHDVAIMNMPVLLDHHYGGNHGHLGTVSLWHMDKLCGYHYPHYVKGNFSSYN